MRSSEIPLLEVENLTVEFPVNGRWIPVVENASFSVARGSTVGLVGESGSGKSVTALAVLGLVQAQGGRISAGSIRFEARELVGLPEREYAAIRGARIGMIFQQPTRSLNPAYTVGEQIAETLRHHRGLSHKAAWDRAVEMLDRVQIPDAARRAHDYPHMFSGGMCQRVMIAIALVCEPDLLIADEPTTALDVSVQAAILELVRRLQAETGVSILFISHDLAVIAELCESIVVMYAGEVVERSPAERLFLEPSHPYTEGLLGAIPRRGRSGPLVAIPGNVPAASAMPRGCRFHPRCAYAMTACAEAAPQALSAAAGIRFTRCIRADELQLAGIAIS